MHVEREFWFLFRKAIFEMRFRKAEPDVWWSSDVDIGFARRIGNKTIVKMEVNVRRVSVCRFVNG